MFRYVHLPIFHSEANLCNLCICIHIVSDTTEERYQGIKNLLSECLKQFPNSFVCDLSTTESDCGMLSNGRQYLAVIIIIIIYYICVCFTTCTSKSTIPSIRNAVLIKIK